MMEMYVMEMYVMEMYVVPYVMRDAGCRLEKSLKNCIIMVLLPLHVQGYRTPHNFN